MDSMVRQIIIPESKEHWLSLRARDVTSTEVAALFGCSPYMTAFELWHRKKNAEVLTLEENERMVWGTRLQDAIAAGIADDYGWTISRMGEYVRVPDLRIGASFDFSLDAANSPSGNVTAAECDCSFGPGLLEIKNVDSLAFKEGWTEDGDGNLEAPTHIEFQVQHQLATSGRRFAYIGALVGGNRVALIRRDRDEKAIAAILDRIRKFWASIDANQPPAPDFSRDLDTIAKIYGYADPGKILDASGDAHIKSLVEKYKIAGNAEKIAKQTKDSVKAELFTLIGDAEKVIGDWGSISAGVVGEALVESYIRSSYRGMRIYFKKEKA